MARASDRAGEAILLIALAASPWPWGSAPDVARYTLAGALLLAASNMTARSEASRALLACLPLLGVPLLCLAQMASGVTASVSWTADALLVLAAMLATLAWVQERADSSSALRLSSVVVAAGLAQAAFGAYSWSIAPTRIYGVARADVTMPFGSFVNHNHFAGFVEMPALLALGMCVGHSRRARGVTPLSIAFGGAALALAASLLASRSRGGLLALVGGLVVFALLAALKLFRLDTARRSQRLLWMGVGALFVLVFAWLSVTPAARGHLLTIFSGPSDASGSYRVAIARATLRLAAAHPVLGSGIGAYEDAIPAFKTSAGDVRTTHAESDVLEFLAEGGLLGLAALAGLGAFLARRFSDRMSGGRDAFWKGTAIGAMSGAAALGFHSLWDFNLRVPANALVFVVLLGLACASSSRSSEATAVANGRWAVVLCLALLGVLSLWRAQGAFAFDQAMRQSDFNSRIAALDRVTRFHPYLAEAWRERAVAWRTLATAPSSLRSDRLGRAVSDFSETLRLRPRWADAWAGRGWTRGMLGDLQGGAPDLDRAKSLDPTHSGIRLLHERFNASPAEPQR